MKHVPKGLILVLVALAQFMVVLDVSIVNVALPAIKASMHVNVTTLQWVVTAYMLTFGSFLLFGGRAADLFGRRRILLSGVAGFSIVSLLIGLAQTSSELIVLRALQGLFAALMSPSALSILLVTFTEGRERSKALGLWSAVAAGGAAIGVLLGGILTQYLSWRWNFFINVPVGLLVLLAGLRLLPAHEGEARNNNLDLPGAALITAALMLLVYTIIKAPHYGWLDGKTLGLFGLTFVLMTGFITNELKASHPLVPLAIFRIRNVSAANVIMTMHYATSSGVFFFNSLYLQTILHYDPVHTGLSFLPFPIILGYVATRVPRVIGSVGYKPVLIVATLLIATALLILGRVPLHGHYWTDIFPALVLMPMGIGGGLVALNIAATSGVSADKAGLASGLINTSQQIGGAFGLAILSGVVTSAVARGVAGHSAPLQAAAHGYQIGFRTALIFSVTALLLVLLAIKQRVQSQAAHAQAKVVVDAT